MNLVINDSDDLEHVPFVTSVHMLLVIYFHFTEADN
jgi:hypothetical protein